MLMDNKAALAQQIYEIDNAKTKGREEGRIEGKAEGKLK